MDYYYNSGSGNSSLAPSYSVTLPGHQPQETPAEQVQVSTLARRIHGWSWQAVRTRFQLFLVLDTLADRRLCSFPSVWALEPST